MKHWRGPVSGKPKSRSGKALNKLLREGGEEAEAIFEQVHFTRLYAYCAGRSRPNFEKARLIEKLSKGRVPLSGWVSDERAQ